MSKTAVKVSKTFIAAPIFSEVIICSIEYRLIRKLGEGTFSEVLKAQSVQTG